MPLGTAGTFYASMEFRVIETDPSTNEGHHPLRCTTDSYHYKLAAAGQGQPDHWRIHWHPSGRSRVSWAHVHRPPDLGQHWPTGRMTLENAVGWCIESGAPLTCDADEAVARLSLNEAPHILHRTWS